METGKIYKGIGLTFKIMKDTPSGYMHWKVLFYYMLLILITDCFIWYNAGSLNGYDWKFLVVYSLMSYPLWIIISLKGLGKEQIDLFESSKWHAVDLFPSGVTNVFLIHYLGKVYKDKWFYCWVTVYVFLSVSHGYGLITILLALLCIMIGSCNLILAGILTRYYSPKGYSNILSSMFYSLTWIFSGAVFPLGMISNSFLFYILNPFGASISVPLSVLDPTMVEGRDQLILYVLVGSIVWFFLFFKLCRGAENSQREKFYS
ncbi:hypothetical protein [Chengkuizengella axinellae]|uniref:ABC transporter permease n=1 Tax=Chengkuizengella axinellae TaxID=3064388 RepID=A0ABT9IZT6_9BACL|nr:hypothetical protein [Chengkuizengella sp. 2205SS18-9]MDP5274842.1 hypothetical protein [Chengkuizengella sp. 2205SS18-9]